MDDLHLVYLYDLPLPCDKAAPIQILRTVHAAAELGVRVTVGVNRVRDPDTALAYYGLAPHPRLEIRPVFPAGRSTLTGRLRELAPAGAGRMVVVSRGETGVRTYAAARALRSDGVMFVYEAHRLGFEKLQEARLLRRLPRPLRAVATSRARRAERAAVEGADGLVCLTAGVRDALAAQFSIAGRPLILLPSGTSRREPGPPAYDDRRDIDVLYLGKLIERKGIDQLLEAIASMPGSTAAVVGGSPEQCARLRRTARGAGIADEHLMLPGYVPPAEVHRWLDRSRIGVCPLPTGRSAIAERYTSPMKVLELMAAGVPIVATDVAPIRALLRHEDTALLVPPNRPDLLADAIGRLHGDRALAERMRCRALDEVAPYYWPERARALVEFVSTLAARRA